MQDQINTIDRFFLNNNIRALDLSIFLYTYSFIAMIKLKFDFKSFNFTINLHHSDVHNKRNVCTFNIICINIILYFVLYCKILLEFSYLNCKQH